MVIQRLYSSEQTADVRVIGVGGAGCNAINRMIEARVQGVRFIAMNTDAQSLGLCQTPVRLHLGRGSGQGLGAGGDPNAGARCAEDSVDDIEELVRDADMVFVVAGMGGGTGTGAAPVVARIAREKGALTVGVVCSPFSFEGGRRLRIAQAGVENLRENIDSLIVIPNDRLLSAGGTGVTLQESFRLADEQLRHGVQGIADLVTVAGIINLDFADVRSVMSGAGTAVMAIGEGNGPNRVSQAVESITRNPLLDRPIDGATAVLLNIQGPEDLTLHEYGAISEMIQEICDPEVNMVIGHVTSTELIPELRITLIATGMPVRSDRVRELGASKVASFADDRSTGVTRNGQRARTRQIPVATDHPDDDVSYAEVDAEVPMRPEVWTPETADREYGGRPDRDLPPFLRRRAGR